MRMYLRDFFIIVSRFSQYLSSQRLHHVESHLGLNMVHLYVVVGLDGGHRNL